MLPHVVTLTNLDAKAIHHHILQLEALQDRLSDTEDGDTVTETLKLLHAIEEGLRSEARRMRQH